MAIACLLGLPDPRRPTPGQLVAIARLVTQQQLRNEQVRLDHWRRRHRRPPPRGASITPWS